MQDLLDRNEQSSQMDLGIEDLESLEAPSYASGAAGILVGIAVGVAVVAIFT